MKILVGIPTAGDLPVDFVNALSALRSKHDLVVVYIARSIIHVARERIVEAAITQGADAVLFLDDDMVFEPELVDKLARHNAPVVSAMCFKRTPPYGACFYQAIKCDGPALTVSPFELTDLPNKPFEAVGAGAACMLIKMEIFKKLQKPWFLPLPYAGEDLSFCYRLAQAGIKVLIDPKPRVGHLETRAIYAEHHIQKVKEARSNDENCDK